MWPLSPDKYGAFAKGTQAAFLLSYIRVIVRHIERGSGLVLRNAQSMVSDPERICARDRSADLPARRPKRLK
jgi:hypothetical protein